MLYVINGEHVNSIRKFKSIEVDPDAPYQVHYCNPFPDVYAQISKRSDLTKAWKKECKLREQELDEFYNEYISRPEWSKSKTEGSSPKLYIAAAKRIENLFSDTLQNTKAKEKLNVIKSQIQSICTKISGIVLKPQ